MESGGGAAFIILNPRNLNGHATIPLPSSGELSKFDLGQSKWSVNSANSVGEDSLRGGKAASIDLEWENDGKYFETSADFKLILSWFSAHFQLILC